MKCRHSPSEEGGSQGLIQRFGSNLRIERASLVAQLVKNLPAMHVTWVQFLVWQDPWRREKLPTPVFWPGELQGVTKIKRGGNQEGPKYPPLEIVESVFFQGHVDRERS